MVVDAVRHPPEVLQENDSARVLCSGRVDVAGVLRSNVDRRTFVGALKGQVRGLFIVISSGYSGPPILWPCTRIVQADVSHLRRGTGAALPGGSDQSSLDTIR